MNKIIKYCVSGLLLGLFFCVCSMCEPPSVRDTVEITVMDTVVAADDTAGNYAIVDTVTVTTVDTISGESADTIRTTVTKTVKVAVPCSSCEFIPVGKLEMPATGRSEEIVSHVGYSFVYNEAHEQANWVAYLLTAERATPRSDVPRKDNFRPDPAVKTGSAVDDDYKNSGFDRGHLAPCADMRWSQQTMDESFFFSNMSPQRPQLNQQTWEKLEELVRTWAKEYDTLYIATGPVLRAGLPSVAETEEAKSNYKPKNRVSVPEYYYKVVLHYTSKEIKGIGFIVPNKNGMGKSVETIKNFAVTIDSVQNLTGINFFYQLPKVQEECAEKSICLPCWNWGKK